MSEQIATLTLVSMTQKPFVAILVFIIRLSGCRDESVGDFIIGDGAIGEDMDGSGIAIGTYTVFADSISIETSAMRFLALDNDQNAAQSDSGRLDHD